MAHVKSAQDFQIWAWNGYSFKRRALISELDKLALILINVQELPQKFYLQQKFIHQVRLIWMLKK